VHVQVRDFRRCRCEDCARDFVEDVEIRRTCAVNAPTFDFERLADEASSRWLNEPCPKKHWTVMRWTL
jgi:hypothetical protein